MNFILAERIFIDILKCDRTSMTYKPMMPDSEVELRKKWHENAYSSMEKGKTIRRQYLKRKFVIPKEVPPPAWMSKLLGKSILEEVRNDERVLDMGTGCGVNAILAASKSKNILAVDVNPYSVETGFRNAKRNGVLSSIEFRESDLFQKVSGRFDLIIFDPPFRWFKPRDIKERAVADEGFQTMTRFFEEVEDYLAKDGRILVMYGDSGDLNYLLYLFEKNNFNSQLLKKRGIRREGRTWYYYCWKLTL